MKRASEVLNGTVRGAECVLADGTVRRAPSSIRVNAVAPTSVGTDMIFNDAIYRLFPPDLAEPGKEDTVEAFQSLNMLPVPWKRGAGCLGGGAVAGLGPGPACHRHRPAHRRGTAGEIGCPVIMCRKV